MEKIETAKRIIEEHWREADCGLFDCRNHVGDPMDTLYEDEQLTILICRTWDYFEVLGLSEGEFSLLFDHYLKLVRGR